MKTSTRRAAAVIAALGFGALALTGCAAATASSPSTTAAPQQQGQQGGGGVTGEIAAVDGTTLQVQSTTEQTAVTYTDSTTITQRVTAALTDVTNGSCISAFTGGTGSSTSTSSSASTAATTVSISAAVDGACTAGGFGGMGGGG
ncbi:hypothetical protein N136_03938, partial [Leifsonia aquatica ATCC 14665]